MRQLTKNTILFAAALEKVAAFLLRFIHIQHLC
jgi:hypothetical protein